MVVEGRLRSARRTGRPSSGAGDLVMPEWIPRKRGSLLDGGELPGTPSTVVDLRRFADAGNWRTCARARAAGEIADLLG